MITYNNINIKSLDELYNIIYCAEEYQFYGKNEYVNCFNFINDLAYDIENNNFIVEDTLKTIVLNWKYKNLLYQTINFNEVFFTLDNKMYDSLLHFLRFRSLSKYDLNPHPLSINIIFDNTNTNNISYDILEQLKSIDEFGYFIQSKKIIMKEKYFFVGEIEQYLNNNNYEVIYSITKSDDIEYGMDNVIVNNNIIHCEDLDNIIKTHINFGGRKIYFSCVPTELLTQLCRKYNTSTYFIIVNTILPGQAIYINANTVNMYSSSVNYKYLYDNIEDIIIQMKFELIKHLFFKKECISCDKKISCMIEQSFSYCKK